MTFFEDLFKKENLLARLLSLIVACALWVYVMTDLNPIVERIYEVPLQYRNLPEAMAVFNAPDKVSVRVRAARTVLNDEADKYISAGIDLNQVTEGQKVLVVSASFANGEVVSVNPHDVSVVVDSITEKTVPVATRVVGNSDDDLTVGNNGIVPSEVVVKGATHRLEEIVSVVAPVNISNQRENFRTESTLIAVNSTGANVPGVTIIPERATVDAVIIRKMDTVVLPVKVNLNGSLPNGVRINQIEAFPKEVSVTAPPSVLKYIKNIDTKPIDINNLEDSTSVMAELIFPDKIIAEVKNVEVRFSVEGH